MIKEKVTSYYKQAYGNTFEFVFSPGRINLIGEHTDYNEGFVFPAAIDKGIYAALGVGNGNKSNLHALDLNDTYSFSTSVIDTETGGSWKNYILGVVAEIAKTGRHVPNFNMVFSGDVPEGSGLSSSAALENSVVFGLNSLFNLGIPKKEMIYISQKAEHNYVGVKCGIMDQYASMFGQKNNALLLDCRTITSDPFFINFENYGLLLINTNVKHNLANSAYNDRRRVCENVAQLLKIQALRDATIADLTAIKSNLTEDDFKKVLYVVQENERVLKAAEALKRNDIRDFGRLMFETHEGLKNQYKVSCLELDFLVDMATEEPGVIGSRMMGGGFGGCTINIVHIDRKANFINETAKAYKNRFDKECSFYDVNIGNGTHLVS